MAKHTRRPKDEPLFGLGNKRGPKSAATKAAAAERAEAAPLPKISVAALAEELVPDGGVKREVMRRLLEGLFESEDTLRVEALAGGVIHARALNEVRRNIARLTGFIATATDASKAKKPTVDLPGSEVDVPQWVPVVDTIEPDDADLNAAALASLGAGDGKE